MQWMIYGVNGYSGQLIARQARALGLQPVLAGRSPAVRRLAEELGLPARLFDLADAAATREGLVGIGLVLNCAGPFSQTIAPLLAACLEAGAHYLDITGEIEVFEYAASQSAAASARGVVVCPGVGFDVVPTDCLAAALKEALPDAQRLRLGFDMDSPMSPGTAKSLLEALPQGGKVRRAGRISGVPLAAERPRIDFGFGPKAAVCIPWGDVSTAYHSTGIGDIRCYIPAPRLLSTLMRALDPLRALFAWPPVQRALIRAIERWVHGPSEAQRRQQATAVWGEVSNARGERRVGYLRTGNPYELTIHAALAVVQHLLQQPQAAAGYQTPSSLCGWRLLERLPGAQQLEISTH